MKIDSQFELHQNMNCYLLAYTLQLSLGNLIPLTCCHCVLITIALIDCCVHIVLSPWSTLITYRYENKKLARSKSETMEMREWRVTMRARHAWWVPYSRLWHSPLPTSGWQVFPWDVRFSEWVSLCVKFLHSEIFPISGNLPIFFRAHLIGCHVFRDL